MGNAEFNLVERTSAFGIEAIKFAKTVKLNSITSPLINQFVRSATSIGANYSEANEANSTKDFVNKICIAKKEAKETIHWLKMLKEASLLDDTKVDKLIRESQELVLIFSAIVRKKS
jgi:four helix bundle protein